MRYDVNAHISPRPVGTQGMDALSSSQPELAR